MAWREELKITKLRAGSLYLGTGLGTLVSPTAAQINLLTQGVAAGYKIARGSQSATDTASVATGLTTIVAGFAMSRADTATKANNAALVTASPGVATGALKLYRWKHTGASTPTLVAATTAGVIDWIAVGT